MMSLLKELSQDAVYYHSLRFPDRQPTLFSRTRVLLASRGFFVLAAYRIDYHYTRSSQGGLVVWPLKQMQRFLAHLGAYLSKVLAKCEIMELSRLEAGVYLSDYGHVILGASSVGSGTMIHDHVTIGMNLWDRGIPEIGRNVWIGPRCLVYGSITVGAGVTLLPGTVLTKSVPPGVVVQGNPAHVLERNFDNAHLRCSLLSEVGSSWCKSDTT